MNSYNVNDKEFINSDMYKNFLMNNPSEGSLRVRAYAANQAIPISGLRVVISKEIDNNNVIFFDGYTNDSGLIDRVKLPTPSIDSNNLDAPKGIIYDITATYVPENINLYYKVNMYENVCVVQNINIVPSMMDGGI